MLPENVSCAGKKNHRETFRFHGVSLVEISGIEPLTS